MSTNTVDPAQPTASTVVVAADGSVTVTQVSNATTVTYPGLFPVQPFSPLDLSPTLWLDASDETTITESGGAVSQWDDKSGNGYDVTQATGTAQPTSGVTTQNGLNVIDFVGSAGAAEQLASANGVANDGTLIVFAVVKRTADFAVLVWPQEAASHTNPFFRFGMYSTSLYINGSATAGSPWTGSYQILRMESDTGDVYTDGTRTINGTGATLTWPNSVPLLLGGVPGATEGFDGGFGEVIVVSSTLTADEISDTETYLADKWGITL